MISAKQIAVVKVAVRQLGFDDATYRAILREHGGVESARDLDFLGFDAVMKHFAACGFRSTWTKRSYGNGRPGMASAPQIGLIRHLWQEWSDGPADDDDAGLNHWLEHHFGVSALRFLNTAGAHKAITALKRMKERKHAKAAERPQDGPAPPGGG